MEDLVMHSILSRETQRRDEENAPQYVRSGNNSGRVLTFISAVGAELVN